MPSKNKYNSLRLIEHSILTFIWLVVLASPVIFNNGNTSNLPQKLLKTSLALLPFIGLSLLNHFVLVPIFFFKRNKWWYFIIAVITSLVFVSMVQMSQPNTDQRPPRPMQQLHQPPPQPLKERTLPPPHHIEPSKAERNLPPPVDILLMAILILGFDTGLRTVFRWTRLEKEREVLEKEKVKSELAFLRNQVSPHFFMNTLNNIHSLIDFDTEEAKDSIIRLSKLMRHLLYDSNAERIPINKEMDFIRNYVDLMKLRFSDKVDIQLNISEQIPDTLLPPLLFTSYVENAFKHGISYQHSSFIYINIHCVNNKLEFGIRNSNHSSGHANEPSGIGTDNSRKRLNLLYGNEYKLHEESTAKHYLIQLTLPL